MASSEQTHLAALLVSAGTPLSLTPRPTPTPSPTELLISVYSIAVNPIDHYQRDRGYPPLAQYPSIIGSDISGIVIARGSQVPSHAPNLGERVTAFAPSFFEKGKPDYGAFQEKLLVPWQFAAVIPDTIGWNEAAVIPMSVQTTFAGWSSIGLGVRNPNIEENRSKGLLVWGGSSSIGSGVIQSARLLGFKVYTTASPQHHTYILSTLKAHRVFDYKDPNVISSIISAAKSDGISISIAYDAVGQSDACIAILNALAPAGEQPRVASAPVLKDFVPELIAEGGVKVTFVVNPQEDLLGFAEWVYQNWLKKNLANGEYIPSPKVTVVEGGLEGLNEALDKLKKGVSGTKLVVEVKK